MQINQREDRGRHQRGLIRNIVDYCRARFIFAQRPNYLTAWHILALTINQKRSFLIKRARRPAALHLTSKCLFVLNYVCVVGLLMYAIYFKAQ